MDEEEERAAKRRRVHAEFQKAQLVQQQAELYLQQAQLYLQQAAVDVQQQNAEDEQRRQQHLQQQHQRRRRSAQVHAQPAGLVHAVLAPHLQSGKRKCTYKQVWSPEQRKCLQNMMTHKSPAMFGWSPIRPDTDPAASAIDRSSNIIIRHVLPEMCGYFHPTRSQPAAGHFNALGDPRVAGSKSLMRCLLRALAAIGGSIKSPSQLLEHSSPTGHTSELRDQWVQAAALLSGRYSISQTDAEDAMHILMPPVYVPHPGVAGAAPPPPPAWSDSPCLFVNGKAEGGR